MSSTPSVKRICPWCGDAHVVAFSDEAARRALAAHLKICQGPKTQKK